MLYYLKKIHHFLTANSRHGTHSPFVYALADEVIYNKTLKRSDSLIGDIITSYVEKGEEDSVFLVTDFESYNLEQLAELQNFYFMIFVKDIYKNNNAHSTWQEMMQDSRFIVLIDVFEFGIICNRKEQPKETFKLRYPYFHF